MEKEKSKKNHGISFRAVIILAVVFFVLAAGVCIYPFVSNIVNEKNRSLLESEYLETVEMLDTEEEERLFAEAEAYNRNLVAIQYSHAEEQHGFSKEAIEESARNYYEILDIDGTGLIGYLDVPAIDLHLPIYHGTEADTLSTGLGHMIGSSFPVGGLSAHSIITGHSGLSGNKIFSELELLRARNPDTWEKGDVFYITVLSRKIAYEVMEINICLPEDASHIAVEKDKDLCTLITCYPYGVNTHRLCVKGSRIEMEEAEVIDEEQSGSEDRGTVSWKVQYIRGIAVAVMAISGLLLFGIIIRILWRYIVNQERIKWEKANE